MRGVIRLGDPTSHGGNVITASTKTIIKGKPVARVGDLVSCPIPGHGNNPIVEGEANFKDEGKPIALDGHKTACGCALISTTSDVGVG
ncbi:MAG: PAAR domain-containing protein [Gilliamella sp.]|nr:PAAR domain-containing protein [Gilliamella sp.]MCO6538083.1 PAAR domain-containing protein [Gilliamella sp.]MCO6540258.1 PAAR domain-containing protein [Gilliamella sp.]